MLLLSTSAVAAPPGATPPTVRPPAATPPAPPPKPVGPPLTAIDPDSVPQKCLDLALRAGSPEPTLAQTSRLSLATCIANERVQTVAVCDCQQSVQDLNEAIAPAVQILDELASVGEPTYRVLALKAEADRYQILAQKLLATLPQLGPNASADERDLHEMRQTMLRPMIEPWLTRAQNAYVEVDRIAKAHPELDKNAEVRTAIADSRHRMTTAVAQP
jgi:hypothetical protein